MGQEGRSDALDAVGVFPYPPGIRCGPGVKYFNSSVYESCECSSDEAAIRFQRVMEM